MLPYIALHKRKGQEVVEVKIIDPMAEWDGALDLIRANWLASNQPIEFVADDAHKFYEYLYNAGALFAIGAFEAGVMVGYCLVSMSPHPFNHAVKMCNVDGFYLLPELRRGRTAAKMMQLASSTAKEKDGHIIHWHAPAGSEFSKTLAHRFTPVNNYFREVL